MAYAEKVYKYRNGVKTKQYTWRGRYKGPPGSKPAWPGKSGFPTQATALRWAEQQEAAVDTGRWIDPTKAKATFGTFARRFMADRQKRGNTTSKRWTYLETYIFPRWEHTPIRDITWYDVDAWQQQLSCEDVTRGHVVSLMSTIITAAVDAGHREANPLFGRRRTKPTATTGTVPAPRKVVEGYVRPEDVLLVAQRLGPARGLHVITTAWAGLRWGEGIGLHRDDVLRVRRQPWDGAVFECPILRVHQEVAEYEQRGPAGEKLGTFIGIEPTKNDGSTRDVDVPPFLAELLRYHLADVKHDFVFSTASGGWWRRGNWGRTLRPAADGRPEREKRQGVGHRPAWEPIAPGMDMRSLRHTHDTWQAQLGVKEPLAYEAMGHRRAGIKRVYQHPTPEMRRDRLEGLEEIFQRAMRNLGLRTLWNRVDLRKIPETGTAQDRQAA
ncbi:tyrosine-type recombinase/integrase [Streptomyces sp. NPDC021224]|uniref:tyrosine-type recombinase/integrase n=1 Tax=unclassified Streptomyces TaxID=2593676 RepID=UPI00379F5B15